jgi:hypothetical protein
MERQLSVDCDGVLADFDSGAAAILGMHPKAFEKRKHAKAGDVLVDDQIRHAPLWEEMGGVFIHHKSVEETLERLGECFHL